MPRATRLTPNAFTLLELCVVMAVAAIFVTVILFAVQHERHSSQRVQCLGRLRQVAFALLRYAQDNEQTLPASESHAEGAPNGVWFTYRNLVQPYLGLPADSPEIPGIFTCPADKDVALGRPSFAFSAANEYHQDFPGLAGARLHSIAEPGHTILLAEDSAFFPVSWHTPHPQLGFYSDAQNTAAFADGHVAYLSFYYDGSHLAAAANPPAQYGYKWSSTP